MENLVVVGILMLPLLIFGMFGNLQLMFVTWRYKQLQHRNGILVGILAYLNFISQLFEMKNAIEILTGNSKMTRTACYNTIFLYGFSFSMACIAMLSLAIDRLIAVSSPIKYRTMQSKRYIYLTLIIGFIYSTPFVVLGFIFADDELIQLCNPPMGYSESLMKAWSYGYASIAGLVIILNIITYFTIHAARRKKRTTNQDAAHYKRQVHITNSLIVMMVVYALTTLTSSFTLFIINFLPVSMQFIASASSFLCLLVLVNYASNYYVLFWRSRDYRSIFLNQFHLLNKDSVISVTKVTEIRAGNNGNKKMTSADMCK